MADRRIKCLNEQAAASVRGGQVIGSVTRAIEELVHNSIEGCAKSIMIELGANNEIVVSDDGGGIDPEAMRMYIGTEYCSNSLDPLLNRAGFIVGGGDRDSKKGESLRSIASLCVEMKIETACLHCQNRKRKLSINELSKAGSNVNGYMIQSEKVFKDGVVVSFNTSSGRNDISSDIIPIGGTLKKRKLGTTITIRGLFHRHIVRRKHHDNASNSAQLRACLRLLALCYPTVSFKLKSTGKVECSYKAPPCTAPATLPSLRSESRALILRLSELYPNEFTQENSIELAFEENQHTSSSNADNSRNFRAFGALCIFDDDDDDAVRNKELEVVAINVRTATHRDKLADNILSQVRLCRGNKPLCYADCSASFFIHVSSRNGELVVKDSISTITIPQVDRLTNFLKRKIAKSMMDSEQLPRYETKHENSNSSLCSRNSSIWNIGGKGIVKGEHIMSSTLKTTAAENIMNGTENDPKSPPSPFSTAFLGTEQPRRPIETKMKPKAKPDGNLSCLSFDDAFLDDSTSPATGDFNYDFEDAQDITASSSLWTKQRVKGLERTIAAMASDANVGVHAEKISLTKNMLATAEVLAQVEEKFIIINACGVICAVDQHAADERVALEKLENALFNPDMHDDMVIHLTNKEVRVDDILKSTKLIPTKLITLTQKDMSTINHHWSSLQRWKFTFEESDDDTTCGINLTGLPSVCGRVAGVNDFMEFVRELGHFTGGEIKPPFVKNVLASNACRYAIMFGDSLTHEACVKLISSLSQCEFCFICAHGRPSVIPLIDMNKEYDDKSPSTLEASVQEKGNGNGNLRFGPKRVIRRRPDETMK